MDSKDFNELYKRAFNSVHAPDELLRKVNNMNEAKPKRKIYAIRKVIYIAAAIVVLFVASNAVVYAATGETWVEQIGVHLIANGEEQYVDMIKSTDENGNKTYEFGIDEKDGSQQEFVFGADGYDADIKDGDTVVVETPGTQATLTEEDGKIYFEIPAMDVKEDITEDFADGKASVTLAQEGGKKLTAIIEGTIDGYTVNFSEE